MTPRKAFCHADFLQGWRLRCAQRGLDPRTGYPLETECVYRLDAQGRRRLERIPVQTEPAADTLHDPAVPVWWQDAALWNDPGKSRSSTEATALANVAAEARRAQGSERPKSATELFWEVFTEGAALRRAATNAHREELLAARRRRHEESLREKYALRGETVEDVEGIRMVVPIKRKAA